MAAIDLPRLLKAPETLVLDAGENKESESFDLSLPSTTIKPVDDRRKCYSLEELKRLSSDFRLHIPLPKDLIPFISRNKGCQQNRKSAKNVQRQASGPSIGSTPAIKPPSLTKQVWAYLAE